MKFLRLYLIVLLCLGVQITLAQERMFSVRGNVTDDRGAALPGAHLQFVSQAVPDKATDLASDTVGYFAVQLPRGYYTLRVSYTGYSTYEARVECTDSINMPPIVLQESSSELAGVVVKADRISYSTKGYKANLSNDPLFKSRTLAEAMQMLPGLYMKQGEFYAYGENIGSVFVNNKRIMFTGTALTSYLATLQAKNITSVEVLNSTADPLMANKMAFVVKITTTSINDGGSASIGASARMSNVNDFQAAPTFNIQQRVGKWSLFLLPSYTPRSKLNRGLSGTTTYQETGQLRKENQMTHLKFKPTLSLAGGLSYELDKNNNLSLNFSGKHTKRLQTSSTHNELYENGLLASTSDGYVGERRTENQLEGMLSYYGDLPVATLYGTLNYTFKEAKGQTNRSQTLGDGLASTYQQDKNAYYHLFRTSLSAEWKLGEAHRIITTAKYVNWDNKNHYCQPLNTETGRYAYIYDEATFDGSLGYEYQKGAWDVNLGTNYLKSRMKPLVMQNGEADSYKYNVNKFLPFATITYVFNEAKYETVTLQYERSYDFSILTAMDPTTDWRSEYTYNRGNPNLRPGFVDEVALQTRIGDFSFRAKFNNELGATMTYSLDDANYEVHSYDNGMHTQSILLYVGFPTIEFHETWRANYYCAYFWKKEHYGSQKQVAGQVSGGFDVMGNLPGNINLNCSATLSSPQRSFYTSLYMLGDVNASLGKWFLRNKLHAGLNCSYTFLTRTKIQTSQYRSDSRFDRSMFAVSFSVSYKFKWGNKRAWVKTNRVITKEAMRMND